MKEGKSCRLALMSFGVQSPEGAESGQARDRHPSERRDFLQAWRASMVVRGSASSVQVFPGQGVPRRGRDPLEIPVEPYRCHDFPS